MLSLPLKILYVDDEPSLLDIVKIFLERTKEFSVETCISSKEALNILKSSRFDAIVSDYQMPEMDGINFLIQVRAEYKDIPFILFTGRGREEVVINAINNGADFYVQKGGDLKAQFAELIHKIKMASQKTQALRDLAENEERMRLALDGTREAHWEINAITENPSSAIVDMRCWVIAPLKILKSWMGTGGERLPILMMSLSQKQYYRSIIKRTHHFSRLNSV